MVTRLKNEHFYLQNAVAVPISDCFCAFGEHFGGKMKQNEGCAAFVAIVGAPNVGKSSLLNAVLKQKIAAVSPKPQTTRTRINGIYTKDGLQLVFVDTPGAHSPRTRLGEYMEKSIRSAVFSVNVCVLVVEAGQAPSKANFAFVESFKQLNLPAILAVNKIDKFKKKSDLLEQIQIFRELYNFAAVVPISARTGNGLEALIAEISVFAESTGHFFAEDEITDQPKRAIVAELVREKILRMMEKEVPHGVAVAVERMRTREVEQIVDLDVEIFCEKPTHKGIIIGKQGEILKRIGTSARREIEELLGTRVNLQLWVRVKEDWRNREGFLRGLGFDMSDFK